MIARADDAGGCSERISEYALRKQLRHIAACPVVDGQRSCPHDRVHQGALEKAVIAMKHEAGQRREHPQETQQRRRMAKRESGDTPARRATGDGAVEIETRRRADPRGDTVVHAGPRR
jgi:hypothetical protein